MSGLKEHHLSKLQEKTLYSYPQNRSGHATVCRNASLKPPLAKITILGILLGCCAWADGHVTTREAWIARRNSYSWLSPFQRNRYATKKSCKDLVSRVEMQPGVYFVTAACNCLDTFWRRVTLYSLVLGFLSHRPVPIPALLF